MGSPRGASTDPEEPHLAEFQQMAAALYLAAGVGALVGMVLPSRRMSRGAVLGLALGAAVHGVVFATLHRTEPTPQLTDLANAVSFMSWIAICFLLVLMWRLRLPGLVAVAGPIAFLSVFIGAYAAPGAGESPFGSGTWSHAHVLLASAGLSLLGVAGLAGLFFLLEHRRLKAKRRMTQRFRLPSLEALDRVNSVALATGFPLLTLGVLTGMIWLEASVGTVWTGSHHETWSAIGWAIYAGLVGARFLGRQVGRPAAASAVGGFAFLLFAVVGVELLA
jgi:ABC-type transport system involved in cytochrome c biogenesis permease subunit